ncbi:nickel pincer cofactor biosynthesis protein LarB [bacterium]|nr:nickel pincer cofactor biosynthesis protein LarB [bacterium]
MYSESIRKLLRGVQQNEIDIDSALNRLKDLPYEDLGFAKVDHHRALRKGFPEVVYCENKTPEQVVGIINRLAARGPVLATRASKETYAAVQSQISGAEFNEVSKTIIVRGESSKATDDHPQILVASAGTSDIPVAEEAAITAEVMGHRVERLFDVGVAGIHRLLDNKQAIERANVLVIVAGMDGALPSVVSGLVDKPVIAVPTSVGYGASFKGVGPLLTMLNACAPGVVVVNIDNGFGAGYFAAMINATNPTRKPASRSAESAVR